MTSLGHGRLIAHVDMDAFYAAVEAHDDPSLRGLPVVVGGPPEKRGVVAAASYEARGFGIRSAMPMARAVSLCPDLIRISPRMNRYREVSGIVLGLLRSFTPLVEPLALDEAFLDLTPTGTDPEPDPAAIGGRIKAEIRAETGLGSSVGLAPNKFVAKLATESRKPDGLTVIAPDEAVAFVQAHPVEAMWGVGEKTAAKLRRLGFETAADLAQAEPSLLKRHFGLLGLRLYELAWARDERPVVAEAEAKSVSHEITFAKNHRELELLRGILDGLCRQVSLRLRKQRTVGRTVNLKLRYGDFTTLTRQATLGHPTDDPGELFEAANRLLELERSADRRPVRLLGVAVTGLLRRSQLNLDLFGAEEGEGNDGPGAAAQGADAQEK
jgi:DNA polymerase-4